MRTRQAAPQLPGLAKRPFELLAQPSTDTRCILLEQELTAEVKHVKKPKTLAGPRVTRRTVIASASLIPLAAIQGAPQAAKSAAPATALSPEQRRILEAFIDRLVPKDELGPGAVECGAAEYIDRSMADYLANEKTVFAQGLAAVDAYARSSQGGAFADLSAEKRDAVLTAIDTGDAPNLRGFFNRARRLTLEGMFGDPSYGGNKDFAGWDLIRYPGAKMAVGPEDQSMKTPPKPYRKALYGVDHGH
jgi:gluconate 2-dehydrogenase gamma chain